MKRLISSSFATLTLALSGCANQPAYWVQTHEPLAEEQIIVLDQMPWPGVDGYVTRSAGRCTIYIRRNADRDCVLRHERQHCAGLNHPNYPHGYDLNCAQTLSFLPRIR